MSIIGTAEPLAVIYRPSEIIRKMLKVVRWRRNINLQIYIIRVAQKTVFYEDR